MCLMFIFGWAHRGSTLAFFYLDLYVLTMTMTMDLFQLRVHEGQKIIGEILHTMIEHN